MELSGGVFVLLCTLYVTSLISHQNLATATRGCPASWVAHGDSCYYINDSHRLVWSAARQECQKIGADLAIISSAQQQSFIFDLVKKQNKLTGWGVWIGIKRKADSKFYWVDGTPLEGHYKNWYVGEPNNYRGAREDCGHMYGKQTGTGQAGTWNDLPCGNRGPSGLLCQKTIKALGVPCNSTCLLMSATKQILAFDFDSDANAYSLISNLTETSAIDIHFNLGYMFWSDTTEQNIKRSYVSGTNIRIIINNTGTCDGLAVEWNALQLYWTDAVNNTISVSDLEGNNQRIIVSSGLDQPSGIVLDPNLDFMFWTDRGQTPKIERSTLNGTHRVTIVTSNLLLPMGIDLDRQNQVVFWVDASMGRVESIDYHGNNRKLLYHDQQQRIYFYDVTFFSPYLYVTESYNNAIFRLNTIPGNITRKAYFLYSDPLKRLVAYNNSQQPPVIKCPALPSPSNGKRLECTGSTMERKNTVCRFSCNDGFTGSGSEVRKCQQSGTWSGQEFVCQTITCLTLPSPSNGVKQGCTGRTTEDYGTVCRFSCKEGYIASGSNERRCQENGAWSGEQFSCQKRVQ